MRSYLFTNILLTAVTPKVIATEKNNYQQNIID